jgi:CheY-like chemotaxis protein
VEVLVEDTGCGMPQEVLARALDPFFTTKEVGKGTGLGLSMVYSTVKAHRGRLELQSEPGLGTRVRLCFPATESRKRDPEPRAARPASSGKALHVLLVDDDDLVLKSSRMLVEVLGHLVTSRPCGEEALAAIEGGLRPDLVILDMNMPGLGGKGTLPRLRALLPEVPILLATGRADQDALDLVAGHGRVTLLTKPFSLGELQAHLR